MWQDYYFTIAGAGYTIALVPAIMDPNTRVKSSTSWMTAGLMIGGSIAYHTLGLAAASCMNAIGAMPWIFLAIYRNES
jgi:hypothetical protein